MNTLIENVNAWQILDSRGRPTVRTRVQLKSGAAGYGDAPAGASKGKHEAVELRDNEKPFAGASVLRAVENVKSIIGPALHNLEAMDQSAIDALLCRLDGTPAKSALGANAILSVSCAVASAAADAKDVPLYRHLARRATPSVPLPMVNILSGGLHASGALDFQDFLAIPHGLPSFAQAMECVVSIHRHAYEILTSKAFVITGVADEGGWGARLQSNEAALEILTQAIERAGYSPGKDVSIAIDAAATHFFAHGRYKLSRDESTMTAAEFTDLLERFCKRYPVVSIEDGLSEDDWDNWPRLTQRLGTRVQIIGDDLFTTNSARVARGIEERSANAVLVKMNQAGTVSEALDVVEQCAAAGWNAVVSARSGETESSFLADLAVASGAGQIKVGSITRSERLAKYNRLLEIEALSNLPYAAGRLTFGE